MVIGLLSTAFIITLVVVLVDNEILTGQLIVPVRGVSIFEFLDVRTNLCTGLSTLLVRTSMSLVIENGYLHGVLQFGISFAENVALGEVGEKLCFQRDAFTGCIVV